MTDRVNALLVVLDYDIRDDDIQPLADAIRQMRNVRGVELNVTDVNSAVAEMRARTELVTEMTMTLQRFSRGET